MNIFERIWKATGDLVRKLFSPHVEATFKSVFHIAEDALPIVTEIAVLTSPDKGGIVAKNVTDAFNHYAVPIEEAWLNGPNALGNALLDLATELLARIHVNIPINTLRTAVQIAYTAFKADNPTPEPAPDPEPIKLPPAPEVPIPVVDHAPESDSL